MAVVLKLQPGGRIRPAKLVNPARETLLFISLFNHCMWQHETCLNLITFCDILCYKKRFQTNCKWSKIRLRLHQRASIFYNPRASRALKWALDPGRKGLRASRSRSWCALLIPPPPPPPLLQTVLALSGCTGVSSGPSDKKFENPCYMAYPTMLYLHSQMA